MKIIYTPIIKPKIVDCYIIKIEYEHGDADSHTYEEVKLQGISEEDFIKYVERFNEVSRMISDNRHYRDFTEELSTEMKFLGFNFPLRYDLHYYDGHFASMSINNIQYFDKSSQEFEVALKG